MNSFESGSHQNRMISIKEEQCVQQILDEQVESGQAYLDEELLELLMEEEEKIREQYELMAEERLFRNRAAVNFQDHKDVLAIINDYSPTNQFYQDTDQDYEDNLLESNSRVMNERQQHKQTHSKSQQHNSGINNTNENMMTIYRTQQYEKMYLTNEEQQNGQLNGEMKSKKEQKQEQYILQRFEKEELRKSKLTEAQILELDGIFPKINHMSMYRHHYDIFHISPSSFLKYFTFKKISLDTITQAIRFKLLDQNVFWTIFAFKNQLIIFRKDEWIEPIILQHDQIITQLCLSKCKKYIALALSQHIIVYQIRKNSNLILYKSFNDLKIQNIKELSFIDTFSNGLKLYFVDKTSRIGLISIEQALIFTKINVYQIQHDIANVLSCDALKIGKCILFSILNQQSITLYTIEPRIEKIFEMKMNHGQNISNRQFGCQKDEKNSMVRWRMNSSLLCAQLLVSVDKKIIIYKLYSVKEESGYYYLQQHLVYNNHYAINKMYIISDYHLLLQSKENVIVIAFPLIPTTNMISGCRNNTRVVHHSSDEHLIEEDNRHLIEEDDRDDEEDHTNYYQSAIVYVHANQKAYKIFDATYQDIMFYSTHTPILHLARLKHLTQELQLMMVQRSCFREAFILLILVFKGMNYSYGFSYRPEQLEKLIGSAVECSIQSLLPMLDKGIVMFRVGWACQVCIQCRKEELVWKVIYHLLKEKGLERYLFEIIEIFILRNQLKEIPEGIFFELITYYTDLDKIPVIEKIIINNKENYDAIALMSLLNTKQMFYLQFYLFSQSIISEETDFYTPFLKAFSSFSHYFDHKNAKYQQIGMMCFWYLTKCFQFQEIPQGMMPRDKKVLIVTDFFLQSISKTFIRKFSEFNIKLLLEAYLTALTNKQFQQIMEEEQENMIKKYLETYCERRNNEQIQTRNLIELLLFHFENNLNTKKHIYMFTQFYSLILFSCKIKPPFEKIVDILIVLFQNKFEEYNLHTLKSFHKPTTEELKIFLLGLIEKQLMERTDRLFIRKLLSFEDKEVSFLLFKIDKNYQLALQHFMFKKNSHQVIPFVYEILSEINQIKEKQHSFLKERKILEVKNFLIKNINFLFKIDKIEALDLFYYLGETTAKILELIETNMCEKIHFLTAVLLKFENEEFEDKQKYLTEHLEEVCSLEQKQMLQYLSKFYYPLDLAISICQQKGNYLAKAIFQQRSGLIEQSFKSYEKLIRNVIYNSKESEQKIKSKVQRYIKECIKICKKFNGETVEDNAWIKILKFINSFIISNHQYKVYLKVEFEKIIQNIINQMIHFLPTTLLITFFTSKTKLELGIPKEISIFQKLFIMVKFDIISVKRCLLIAKQDLKQSRKLINTQNKQGAILGKRCDFCFSLLSDEFVCTFFHCGHAYHKICNDDDGKCLTCYYQSENAIFLAQIFKLQDSNIHQMKKQKKKQEKKMMKQQIYVETKAQAMFEQRKKKMKLFDFEQDAINCRFNQNKNEEE